MEPPLVGQLPIMIAGVSLMKEMAVPEAIHPIVDTDLIGGPRTLFPPANFASH